jgi:predicted RNA-binding Zn ribbon-like protein
MTLDPIAALIALLATSPLFEHDDGLHYVSQLDSIAERAGLRLPEEKSLASDIGPVRRLREILVAALFDDDAAYAAERLTLAALDYGLHPELSHDGGQTVASNRTDFVGRLAARLVPTAMELVAEGLMTRLRICSDVWCRSPFLDRTRNRNARFCSPNCSARTRMRRFREAA